LLVREALVTRWRSRTPQERYFLILERIAKRELSPWQAVEELTRSTERVFRRP